MSFPSEFYAAIIGAVVGAVIGGIISFCIQWYAIRESRLQKKAEKLATQKMLATSVSIKMNRIYSDMHIFNKHLSNSIKRQEDENLQPWQATKPLAVLPKIETFSMEEKTFVHQLCPIMLFDTFVEMDRVHRSLIGSFELYNSTREELASAYTTASQALAMVETRSSIEISQRDFERLQPKMVKANSLLSQMSSYLEKALPEAKSCATQLHDCLVEAKLLTGKLTFI